MHPLWHEPNVENILWDVVDEHVDEAEFLWGSWERALFDERQTLREVVLRVEERLLAHVDALAVGGAPVRGQRLIPTLEDERPHAVCAATLALLLSGPEGREIVKSHVGAAEGEGLQAMCRAIGVCPHPEVAHHLLEEVESGRTELACVAPRLQALNSQAIAVSPKRLCDYFDSGVPSLQAAAATSARFASHPDSVRSLLDAAYSFDASEVREAALTSGSLLRFDSSYQACCQALESGSACAAVYRLMVSRPKEHARVFEAARQGPSKENRCAALWSLAYVGNVAATQICLEAARSEALLPAALDSFHEITGCPLDNRGKLSLPKAQEWWSDNNKRFEPGIAHCRGVPIANSSSMLRVVESRMSRLWDRVFFEQLEYGAERVLPVGLMKCLIEVLRHE